MRIYFIEFISEPYIESTVLDKIGLYIELIFLMLMN